MAPAKIPEAVAHYDVRKGDSLWSIAAHWLGSGSLAGDLGQLNGLAPKAVLAVGQRLILPNFQRSDLTVAYMLGEMTRNAAGPKAQAIADALARGRRSQAQGDKALQDMRKAPWYDVLRRSGDEQTFEAAVRQAGVAQAEAMALWFAQVHGPKGVIPAGPWDHKPILRGMYEAMPSPPRPFGVLKKAFHFPIRGDLFHEFYYDVWSNVHYGYVGTRCGFDEATLQGGAASGLPLAGDNDEGDVVSVKIGIDLWKAAGAGLTADKLRRAILAQTATFQAARSRELGQGVKPADATNVVIENNDYK